MIDADQFDIASGTILQGLDGTSHHQHGTFEWEPQSVQDAISNENGKYIGDGKKGTSNIFLSQSPRSGSGEDWNRANPWRCFK
jgi:hypothetical protein